VKAAERKRQASDDAARAIRFMATKAAIFILIPALVAGIAVYFKLK
jgi:hypothetical protein